MQLEVGSIEHLVKRLVFSFVKAVPVDKSPYIITTFPWGFLFLLHLWRGSVGGCYLRVVSVVIEVIDSRQANMILIFTIIQVSVALNFSKRMVNTMKLVGTRAALF